jgi:YD repeat-containing protein
MALQPTQIGSQPPLLIAVQFALAKLQASYIAALLTGNADHYASMHAPAPTFPRNPRQLVSPAQTRIAHNVQARSISLGLRAQSVRMLSASQLPKTAINDPLAMTSAARSGNAKKPSRITAMVFHPSYTVVTPTSVSGLTGGNTTVATDLMVWNSGDNQYEDSGPCTPTTTTTTNAAVATASGDTINFVGAGSATITLKCGPGAAASLSVTVTDPTPTPAPTPSPCPSGWTGTPPDCVAPTPTPPPTPTPSPTPTPQPPLSTTTTGINKYWTYEVGSIPGVGQWMLNIGTGNLLVQESDIDIHERAIDLAFQRTWNAQSQHDVSNDDGSVPSNYGNGWTNTFDAHIGYNATTNKMSVYDIDGARYDYTSNGSGGWVPPAGMHNTLTFDGGCGYFWTKTNGTIYYFYGPNCGDPVGYGGRLYAIIERNHNNYILFTYSWTNGDPSSYNNVAQITATHSDGQALTLTFADFSGHRLLASIAQPGGAAITYGYDQYGNLTDAWEIGNDASSGATPIHHQYGYTAAASGSPSPGYLLNYANSALWVMSGYASGAYVAFGYDGSNRATAVQYTGTVNPVPTDGTGTALQSGYTTGAMLYRSEAFSYGSGQTSFTDTDGHATNWSYDVAWRVTQKQEWTGSLWLVSYASWDANNNLTEATDVRGSATDYAYDSNGNTIAVAQPSISTNQGTFRPTGLYSYDRTNGANNIVAYCDPIRTHTLGQDWTGNPGISDSLCPNSAGATRYAWDYSDGVEPFGRLNSSYTPLGYHRSYSYSTAGQGGDFGLPTDVIADCMVQVDGNNRCPHQTFGYDSLGNLASYNTGNGTWNLTYDGLNRLGTTTDPDGYTSYAYYFANGQASKSETPYQHARGVGPTFSYDADGNVTQSVTYHGGSYNSNGLPTLPPTAATTHKFYDGADRLVEVQEAHDSANAGEAYANPWITRYIYDLSQNGTNQRPAIAGQTLFGYGALVKTEELLPSGDVSALSTPPSPPTAISNTQYKDVKGKSFDALGRPTARFYFTTLDSQTNVLKQETFVYDSANPIGSNVTGDLSQDCNTLNQCIYYAYDAGNNLAQVSYSASTEQNRSYTYDADARATSIAMPVFGTQSYAFDADGRKTQSVEPNGGNVTSPATLTYHYYSDGSRSSLDVGSSALNQASLLTYSYRNDGQTEQQQVRLDSNPLVGTTSLNLTYSNAGRVQQRTETGPGSNATPTSYLYDPTYGYMTQMSYPGGSEGTLEYDPSGSQLGEIAASPLGNITTAYTYTLRGELTLQSSGVRTGPTVMANGISVAMPLTTSGTTAAVQFDSQMGTVIGNSSSNSTGSGSLTTTFDAIGRVTQNYQGCETSGDGCTGASTYTVNHAYDQDNHLVEEDMPDFIYAGNSYYQWGPNAHPIRIGQTPPGGGSPSYETLHWDGDVLLFTTNGSGNLDDVKVGAGADITPLDSHYSGLTFWDRDPSSSLVYCHNATGAAGNGVPNPGVYYGRLSGIPHYINPCSVGPVSVIWWPTPNGTYRVGSNGLLGMMRSDGFSDGFTTIQGVRSFDSQLGAWSTPDAYAGEVNDPMTQKSYVWNGDNPVQYSDPSGFSPIDIQGSLLGAIVEYMRKNSPSFNAIYKSLELDSHSYKMDIKPLDKAFGGWFDPYHGEPYDIALSTALTKINDMVNDLAHEVGHALDQFLTGQMNEHQHQLCPEKCPSDSGKATNMAEYIASVVHDQIMAELAKNGYDPNTIDRTIATLKAEIEGENDLTLSGHMKDWSGLRGNTWDVEGMTNLIRSM